MQSLLHRIIRNSVFNLIGKSWAMLVSFILTPYIISRIGIERFGIWAITGVITNYFGLFDFCVLGAFVKYVAEFHAKKDYQSLNQVVNTGFIFYSLLAIFTIGLSFFVIEPLLSFLKVPSQLHNETLFVFLLGIAIFCIYNAVSAFSFIPDGLQRMDITNKVAVVVSIPNILGTIFFLERGFGLPGLMINNAIILIISSIINISIGFKILPQLRFSFKLFSKSILKKLFFFGSRVQFTRLAVIINNSLVKLLTSHFLNLSLVGFYEIGEKIIMLARDFFLVSISALLPVASETEAKNDWDLIRQLYLKVAKYFNGLVIPAMVLIFITAPLLILAWTGQVYKISVLVIWLLVPGQIVNILTAVGAYIALGVGKPGIAAKALTISALLNLILSTTLILKIGFFGAVLGTSVSLFIGSIIFIRNFNKFLKSSTRDYIQSTVLKPVIASSISTIVIFLINHSLTLGKIYLNRITSLYLVCLEGIIFGCIYAMIILKMHYLDATDRQDITKIVNALWPRR